MRNCIYIAFVSFFLLGCTTISTLPGNIELTESGYPQTYYQIEIISHDGTPLRATLFQPALPLGETAPLIIHAHGFGAFRVSDPLSLYAKIAYTGEAALQAWQQGYWMISYDQRGFGSSGGAISLMSPDKEVKDVSSVINWAIDNIPNLKKDEKDYRIGMIGESYGGGAQLLASVMDSRIDAIIPVTTWHDFSTIIEQGGTKTLWPAMLYYGGQFASGFNFTKEAASAFDHALANEITDDIIAHWREQSLSHYCANKRYPQADTLLIQAFSDSIMPVDHAIFNQDCIRKGGKDVRSVLIQDGHNIPIVDGYNRFPFFSIDDSVHCGAEELTLINIALSWWDEKLKGVKNAASRLPPYCVSFDYDHGITLNTLAPSYKSYNFQQQQVMAGLSGLTEFFLEPIDSLRDTIYNLLPATDTSTNTADSQATGGFFRPLFIPVSSTQQIEQVFGSAKVTLSITHEDDSSLPLLAIGLGKRKASESHIELINRQVVSVTQYKPQPIQLPTISTRLEKGDTLGILIYGYHPHYMFRGPFLPVSVKVAGSIEIPYINEKQTPSLVQQQ